MSEKERELQEENRHLKDQLATLSKTHAKDRQKLDELLSDYIRDKRIIGEALGLDGENAMVHLFQLREIRALLKTGKDSSGSNAPLCSALGKRGNLRLADVTQYLTGLEDSLALRTDLIEEHGGHVSISASEARQILDVIGFVQTLPLYLQKGTQ